MNWLVWQATVFVYRYRQSVYFASDNKSIRNFQKEMYEWNARNFPNSTSTNSLLVLVEEVGEVCRAKAKSDAKIRGSEQFWRDELEKEIGDVFIPLAIFAAKEGFDLQTVINKRWEKISKRDWIADSKTGGCDEHKQSDS